jgi:uncharacterized protein YaaW (UPF0174 family)
MSLNYRYDPDLEFLKELESEELNDLVNLLIYDPNDNEERISQELKECEEFRKYYPDHVKYWDKIAAELQKYGGNTFANLFRGGVGVPYREILMDVCDKFDVNYNKYSSTERIEENLLMKILKDALEKMSDEERKELLKAIGLESHTDFSAEGLFAIFQAVFRAGGFKSYQLTVIIVNAILKALIGRGLSLAGNAMLTRTMAILTGPIGWAITALWTAIDIAGPAYRVTVPAVIEISYLRKKHKYKDVLKEINFN